MTPVQLAQLMYEQERQDERAFFSTTAALLLGGLSVAAGIIGTVGPERWQLFVIGPAVATATYAYFALQTVVGARRRVYLAALEAFLQQEGGDGHTLDLPGSSATIPVASFSRYSWAANTLERFAWWPSKALFAISNGYGVALTLSVTVVSLVRLRVSTHSQWLWLTGFIAFTQLVVLALQVLLLLKQDNSAWKKILPEHKPS